MKSHQKITIAIDGFSSCGKSTLARSLANELGYVFIDTGAMYRAMTLFCFQQGWIDDKHVDQHSIIDNLYKVDIQLIRNNESNKLEVFLNNKIVDREIRSLEISSLVSKVASIKEVRHKLVKEQQKIGINGGVVMDGRDIGSVVFPNAELKIFVTASPEVRTERRYKELVLSEPNITREEIRKNLEERDFLDSTRTESPLIQTEDAILLDNSNISKQEQLEAVLEIVKKLI